MRARRGTRPQVTRDVVAEMLRADLRPVVMLPVMVMVVVVVPVIPPVVRELPPVRVRASYGRDYATGHTRFFEPPKGVVVGRKAEAPVLEFGHHFFLAQRFEARDHLRLRHGRG